jgi:hypothetical protein
MPVIINRNHLFPIEKKERKKRMIRYGIPLVADGQTSRGLLLGVMLWTGTS